MCAMSPRFLEKERPEDDNIQKPKSIEGYP